MLCLRALFLAVLIQSAFALRRSSQKHRRAGQVVSDDSHGVGSSFSALPADAHANVVQMETEEDVLDEDDDEEKQAAVGKLGMGVRRSRFADDAPRAAAVPEPLGSVEKTAKKRVLMVIDVQDGYDAEFLETFDGPGGLAHIQALHPVSRSVELGGRGPEPKKVIQEFEPGSPSQPKITYDKGWNRGVPDAGFEAVTMRAVSEIKSGAYDLVVFTSDYLERAKPGSHELGIFALDNTPWSDSKKPIAQVGYGQYLTFAAGGPGVDISRRIREQLPDVTNGKGEEGTANGVPALFFRKQVDDAFDDGKEVTERTNNEPWLDDVDVDEDGLPQREAQTLLEKLTSRGFGPEDAVLSFVGVVTNRCVAKTLVHAVSHGYQTRALTGGCAAMTPADHAKGLDMIREKGGDKAELVE